MSAPRLALLTLAAVFIAGGAQAAVRLFSYDPANAVTRRTAGGLTFEFEQKLIFIKVRRVRSTEGEATADLKPASEDVLGRGGLTRLIGPDAHERDLYEVTPTAEGKDLIHAFCPGSERAWMAFGRLAQGRDLRVQVLGDTPAAGHARLCETLDFAYRGEWKLPTGQAVRERDMKIPHFPY